MEAGRGMRAIGGGVSILAVALYFGGGQSMHARDGDGDARKHGIEEIRIHVDGLACPFCAFNIEKRLVQLEGVSGSDKIDVDVPGGVVSLDWEAGVPFDPEDVNEQVRRAGFTPNEIKMVASGTGESPGGDGPGHLHLFVGGDKPVVVLAGEAGQHEALESKLADSEKPVGVRVEGTVRQKDDSWGLVLEEWEPL